MRVDLDAGPVDGLRALADPVRWRILGLLAEEELCVCHLVELLDIAQPLASHHLKVLRQAGLIDSSRYRYWTYYRLRPEALSQLGEGLMALATGAPAAGQSRRPCC